MILFQEEHRLFTIHTDHTTYQMMADPHGVLLHLYYGSHTEGSMEYLLTYQDRGYSGNPYDLGKDRTYSLDALPQEFPTWGTGDYRSTLLEVESANKSNVCDLRYREHRIFQGKYSLPGLPAAYSEEDADDAQTLAITLTDNTIGLEVTLLYGVLPHCDVITRSAILRNTGEDTLQINRAQTACLDLLQGQYDLTVFQGRHTLERIPHRQSVQGPGCHIGSRRGASSHQYNPFMILSEEDATEDAGKCWSMQLVYSGSFYGDAQQDQFHQTRMVMGLSEYDFRYPLEPGKDLVLPEVLMSFSNQGFATLSHHHHEVIRRHICRGSFRDVPRPVLINSWEAAYFDFTGETIFQLAKDAKDMGIEMVVMDDGWFGKRDDDCSGLGDWTPNESKLQGSLSHLIQRITELDMKFGIWMEPEMVSEDSDLYREHPDWVLSTPGRLPVRSRYQLPLDLSRPEVCQYLLTQITNVLDQGDIHYLKWDCNRNIADFFSQGDTPSGAVSYNYMLGLYGILEELHQRYPNLLIEGCYGGGGRFDAGMLYYTPQIWCSDNTDPIDRLSIQHGTSFGYPACTVGAHVSISPNHQTGRETPLETRAAVAMAGTFGYELNPALLSDEEKESIRQQIATFHQDAPLVQQGTYYRLSIPKKDPFTSWCFVSPDRKEVLFTAVATTVSGNQEARYARLKGLEPGTFYRVQETKQILPADGLMDFGYPLPGNLGEFHSVSYHFSQIKM